jgi:hypothetical protein
MNASTKNYIQKSKGKYLWDCLYNRLYIPTKITNTGLKDGIMKAKGFKTSVDVIAKKIEDGRVIVIDDLSHDGFIAKLVTIELTTRVVVPVNATDDEIYSKALPRFSEKLVSDGHENITNIVDDVEMNLLEEQFK